MVSVHLKHIANGMADKQSSEIKTDLTPATTITTQKLNFIPSVNVIWDLCM